MRKNKGGFNAGRILLCCMASVVATGCVKNPSDGPKPDDPSAGDYQTFATAQSYAANIDYRLNVIRSVSRCSVKIPMKRMPTAL